MKKSIISTAAALLLSTGVLVAPAATAEVLVFDSSRSILGTDTTTGNSVELFPADTLSAGNPGFVVPGRTSLNGLGGSYAGNLNLVTAPVPEPASYGMLAAGLGMLAFTARRSKSHKLH